MMSSHCLVHILTHQMSTRRQDSISEQQVNWRTIANFFTLPDLFVQQRAREEGGEFYRSVLPRVACDHCRAPPHVRCQIVCAIAAAAVRCYSFVAAQPGRRVCASARRFCLAGAQGKQQSST